MNLPSGNVAESLARLREAGERVTPGRRAVLEVLDGQVGHLGADDIAARVAVVEPGVHRATVYRSLQALVDVGLVTHTHVPGGATIYHLTPRRAEPDVLVVESHGHAHLQCTVCERFTDVPVEEFAPLVARIDELFGFRVDADHAALLGTCRNCREGVKSHPASAEA